MFSNRFDWQAATNNLSLVLDQKRAMGRMVCDLTMSNPTRAGFAYDAGAILAALSQPDGMIYEPAPQGLACARVAVADYYRLLVGDIDPGRIFLTASTSEAYGMLAKMLGDPGDEVLIPRPGYPLLSHLMRFEGLRPIAYPLRYHDVLGWHFDLEVLSALITPRTRAVVVVNPNNPTGSYIKNVELRALDALCCRYELALIVDEVFADFSAGEASGDDRVMTAVQRTQSLCFVLNGFSKLVGLPQVKLGWIAVSGESGKADAAGGGLSTLLDFYLSVSAPVQHAAARLLALRQPIQDQIQSRLARNCRFLREQVVHAANFSLLRREGGWYAIVDIVDAWRDEARAVHLLNNADTLVHPGIFYDFGREGYVVLSLLPEPAFFEPGVRHLVSAFAGT